MFITYTVPLMLLRFGQEMKLPRNVGDGFIFSGQPLGNQFFTHRIKLCS